MLEAYREHTRERGQQGIPPLALNAAQVAELVELVKNPPAGEEAYILDLLTNNVPPGVDDAAYVKAAFLADVAKEVRRPLSSIANEPPSCWVRWSVAITSNRWSLC